MQKICRSLSLSPVTEIMEDRVLLGELQRDEYKRKARLTVLAHKALSTTVMCKKR